MNRRVDRRLLFQSNEDYEEFRGLLAEAQHRFRIRILEWVLMPNHWHMLLWPDSQHQLPKFMNWLTSIHARIIREKTDTVGEGAVYQSRYRAFPVRPGPHLDRLRNYLAMNPVKAHLVENSYNWPWGSAKRAAQIKPFSIIKLDDGPEPFATDLTRILSTQLHNDQTMKNDLENSLTHGTPFGDDCWVEDVANKLNLQSTTRRRGRPHFTN
jgi:putative transposase